MRLQNAFIDWLTCSQCHPAGGIPIVSGGVTVFYDSEGNPRFERNQAAQHVGSYSTSIRVASDGYRVSISGNIGRFARSDNLFGFGVEGLFQVANRILHCYGLPPFTTRPVGVQDNTIWQPCYISRLDFTVNYEAGSHQSAQAVIRFLASRAISRAKRGNAGAESFWFANTRKMFKAYIKATELLAHGHSEQSPVYEYCAKMGIVRFELELKKRLLHELNMNTLDDLNQEALEAVFEKETAFARVIDRSSDEDFLEQLPRSTRQYAQLWLDGNDVRTLCSERQLYHHNRILRDYGVNLFEKRNIQKFPTKVRIVDLKPAEVPDWYIELHKDAA